MVEIMLSSLLACSAAMLLPGNRAWQVHPARIVLSAGSGPLSDDLVEAKLQRPS